jgi:hypothetical protein
MATTWVRLKGTSPRQKPTSVITALFLHFQTPLPKINSLRLLLSVKLKKEENLVFFIVKNFFIMSLQAD